MPNPKPRRGFRRPPRSSHPQAKRLKHREIERLAKKEFAHAPLDHRLIPRRLPRLYEFTKYPESRPVSRRELEIAVSKRIDELTHPNYKHEKSTGYMRELRELIKARDVDALHEKFEDTNHYLKSLLVPHPNNPIPASPIISQMAYAHIELEALEEAKRKGFIGPLQKSSLDRKRKGKT